MGKEYRNPKLVTGFDKPQSFLLKFFKKHRNEIANARILDLGCGTGRNSNYLAQKGVEVYGLEISDTAIELAKKRAGELGLDNVHYLKKSIGEKYPFADNFFDFVFDITSSNSLNEEERKIYLSEVARVLKKTPKIFGLGKGGVFFVRALCKDGDKNAKFLLKNNPGKEKDTYVMPGTGLVEKVFSKEDLVETYSKYFNIESLEKTESYSKIGGRSFKRSFWLVTLSAKE